MSDEVVSMVSPVVWAFSSLGWMFVDPRMGSSNFKSGCVSRVVVCSLDILSDISFDVVR